MTDELKPCPFCGGKPQPRLDDCINGKMVENPMFYIACENLGCGVWPEAEGRYETQYDAIVAAWNRRSLPAAEARERQAVEAERERCAAFCETMTPWHSNIGNLSLGWRLEPRTPDDDPEGEASIGDAFAAAIRTRASHE